MKPFKGVFKIINKYRERNYDRCPNCGINWVYLEGSRIILGPSTYPKFLHSITICNDCVKSADPNKIYELLISSDWPSELASNAVSKLMKQDPIRAIRKEKLKIILKNEND